MYTKFNVLFHFFNFFAIWFNSQEGALALQKNYAQTRLNSCTDQMAEAYTRPNASCRAKYIRLMLIDDACITWFVMYYVMHELDTFTAYNKT